MNLTEKLKFGTIAVVGLAAVAWPVTSYHKTDTVDTVITKTLEKKSGEGEKYLIFTESGEYQNTDSIPHWKFGSSTVQNEAEQLVGQPVTITKYGWRIPIFSSYENVTNIEPR